jgi:hypothetical protein
MRAVIQGMKQQRVACQRSEMFPAPGPSLSIFPPPGCGARDGFVLLSGAVRIQSQVLSKGKEDPLEVSNDFEGLRSSAVEVLQGLNNFVMGWDTVPESGTITRISVGITVNERCEITRMLHSSPAHRSKLLALDDTVVRVDGELHDSAKAIHAALDGEMVVDSYVTLHVRKAGTGELVTVTLQRDPLLESPERLQAQDALYTVRELLEGAHEEALPLIDTALAQLAKANHAEARRELAVRGEVQALHESAGAGMSAARELLACFRLFPQRLAAAHHRAGLKAKKARPLPLRSQHHHPPPECVPGE